MSEVNNEKPKVTRRSSLKCRRINAKPNPTPVGAVKKNGKRSSISWGQIDTFEFKEMKPTFQENKEIVKEKTKEEEERHKKFLETRRRSISNEFISEKDMMKACIKFIEEIFEEERNQSENQELEKINETHDSYSSYKNEEKNKKGKKGKRKESSSSSDSSSSKSSCSRSNCSFRREFNRKNNESKKDKENDKKIEKKGIKSPKPEKKKEKNKTIKFKMIEKEEEKEKEKEEEIEKEEKDEKEEKEEKIIIKKNKNAEKKNEGKKVLKEKIVKKEKEKQKIDENESKEEELEKRKEEPENKMKKEYKGKIMSEFRASNKVRLISYKEARELDLDTVAYIVLTDGSVLVVRKEYGNKKQNIIKKKIDNKTITNLSKRNINKNLQGLNNNKNKNNMPPPQIQMNEIQLPNFKKIIFQNEIQEQPIPSIYPKQNFNFNTQIFPNNNISFLAQNYKKNFKKINNNLNLKLNKMSISPSFKMDRDKKSLNYFSPKNLAKKRYINHNYAQSLKNISMSNNHPQFRKFIKISPPREDQSNRYTIINAIPFYDENSNQMLDNSSQVNAESVLFPDLGDSDTNVSQYNRYKTIKQPTFIYTPIKCNFNEDNYNSIEPLNL